VVVLLVLMASGYNREVPWLHPAASTSATIIGDRDQVTYLFLENGTLLNDTFSALCPECPITVASSGSFAYSLTVTNPFNASMEVTHLSAAPPFTVLGTSPAPPQPIAAGLSQTFELSLRAPTAGGVYAIPFVLSVSVA